MRPDQFADTSYPISREHVQHMDVRQLEMFRAVVEEGAFTRAADRLHVSQSAI
ncbi:MAG: LysR family transcriptional regulator, partial [Thermoanaerobaculia bacterium]